MTVLTATRPTPYRPAVSKHALAMLPPPPAVAAPLPSPPIPMPAGYRDAFAEPEVLEVVPVVTDPRWSPVRCHTVLPTRRRWAVRTA